MNILVTLDRNYLPPLRVMLGSLLRNDPGETFEIYAIGDGLLPEDWAALEELCAGRGRIHPLEVPADLFADAPVARYWTRAMYYRLLAAELLFFIRRKKIANIVKTAFVIPMLVPGIVTTLTWRYLYNNDFGFTTILKAMGLDSLTRNWLNDETTALWCVILVGFPFVSGLYFLIFHAGINNIGMELYEAAVIDGASSLQVVTKVHLPNVVSYINVIFTLSLIGSLSNFGLVAATTGGGPGNATLTPSLYMYKVAFGNSADFGYASTMGVALFVIIMIVTLLTRKIFSEKGAD